MKKDCGYERKLVLFNHMQIHEINGSKSALFLEFNSPNHDDDEKDDDDINANINDVDKIKKSTNDQSIDGILNAVAETGQLSCIRVLSESILKQLAEHVGHVCRQRIHVR